MLTRAVVRTCVHPAVHLFSRRHVPIRSSAAATETALASHISLREDHIVVRAVSTSGMLRATTLYYECRAGRDFIRFGLALTRLAAREYCVHVSTRFSFIVLVSLHCGIVHLQSRCMKSPKRCNKRIPGAPAEKLMSPSKGLDSSWIPVPGFGASGRSSKGRVLPCAPRDRRIAGI